MGVKAEGILRVCQGESSNFRIAVSGAVRVSEQFVGCNRGAFAIAMSHGSAAVGVWTHKGCWPGGCRTTCRSVAVIINTGHSDRPPGDWDPFLDGTGPMGVRAEGTPSVCQGFY